MGCGDFYIVIQNSLQGKMYTTSIKQKRKIDGNISKCK